jgi:hypothetical protein
MARALLAYVLLILVVGVIVTAVTADQESHGEGGGGEKTEHSESEPGSASAAATLRSAPEVARRVERLREKRFRGKAPEVRLVPRAELDRQLAEAGAPPRGDEKLGTASALLLAQIGAVPAEEAAKVAEHQYLGPGAYLAEERAVVVEQELAKESPRTAEIAAARELTHAIDAPEGSGVPDVPPMFDDEGAARTAVLSGAGLLVGRAYAKEYAPEAEKENVQIPQPDLPPALLTLAAFPRAAGGAYVTGLLQKGGVRALDRVIDQPPKTTREILHADAVGEPPARTPDFEIGPVLGEGWTKLAGATVGELDTIALLRSGLRQEAAVAAAAGWRAGAFETWTRGTADCPPPCRRESASIIVWRLADAAASLRFLRATRRALLTGSVKAEPDGGRGFTIDDGGAALIRAGRFAALTFAPTSKIAGEMASTALEP